jgi:hypothetical protein
MPIEIKVVRARSGIRNAHTRMPFRFGVITMRAAPLLTLAVEVEDRRGARGTGYAADFLAYRWFDKRPEKSLADNCADLRLAPGAGHGLRRVARCGRYDAGRGLDLREPRPGGIAQPPIRRCGQTPRGAPAGPAAPSA